LHGTHEGIRTSDLPLRSLTLIQKTQKGQAFLRSPRALSLKFSLNGSRLNETNPKTEKQNCRLTQTGQLSILIVQLSLPDVKDVLGVFPQI